MGFRFKRQCPHPAESQVTKQALTRVRAKPCGKSSKLEYQQGDSEVVLLLFLPQQRLKVSGIVSPPRS